MKKTKSSAKSKMPDSSAAQGISSQNPHEDFAKKDASFKKSRGGSQS